MKAKPRKKVTLRASKITSLYVPRSLVENPPNFSQPDKKKPFKIRIPFWVWFPLVLFLLFIFSTILTPQKSNIPDYMTTTNTYKPITPIEPVKVEKNVFMCGSNNRTGTTILLIDGMACAFNTIFSNWFGVLLFLPISIIVLGLLNALLKSMR